MKEIYFILLCLIVITLIACDFYICWKKPKNSMWLIHLISAALAGAIAYGSYMLATSRELVLASYAAYYWSTDFICFFMLKFSFSYTEYQKKKIPFEIPIVIGILLDGLAFVYNNYSNWMFDVQSNNGMYGFSSVYTNQYKAVHYLHLTFCYVLLAYTIERFLYKAKQSSRVFRVKYLAIILPLIVAIVCNVISVCMQFSLDYSVPLYGLLAIIICYIVFHLTPTKLIEIAQSYIAENTKQGLLCFDETDRCIFANKVFRDAKALEEDYVSYFRNWHLAYEQENKDYARWQEEKIVYGEKRYFSNSYHLLRDNQGRKMGYFFTVDDETERILMYEEEKFKASHDGLTGLLNREAFFREVDKAMEEEPDVPRYMIVSDIKDFKLVNSLYGEEYGNNVLKYQAELINKYKTDGNICARIAGDKFAMLLQKDKFDKAVFMKAVQEINDFTNANRVLIHYHIGIYDVTGIKENAQVLFNRVSLAISLVHNDYERVFVEYNQEIMTRLLEKKVIINDFDRALEGKQFCMYLQPQVDREGKVVGAEALVRWKHPQKGMIFPDSFIGVFEESNLIHRLDLEIWNQAAAKLAEWKRIGREDLHISINISIRDFYYLNVYEELVKIVQKYEIDPVKLKLEITESAVMSDKKNNFAILYKLKEFGFDIELDDFGSGYSSLNMLKDFHVDVLKIDRMFLKETDNMDKSRIILETVISLAKQLDMQIVTEGVETGEQVHNLLGMGCDYFQGYYFDKPISVDDFEEKYMKQGAGN